MPYQIVRNKAGWILNETGQVLVRDSENNDDIWIDSNLIHFDQFNRPCIWLPSKGKNAIEQPLTFLHIDLDTNNNSQNSRANLDDDVDETHIDKGDIEEAYDESIYSIRNIWTHESTLGLISTVESRYEDLFHIHKKKNFWNIVHEELLSNGMNYLPKTCQKKWENLLRTYKSCKDLKTKTGRGATKFKYYDRMDEILGDTPTNSSPHSVDVFNIATSEQQASREDTPSPLDSQRKRKSSTMEYVKLKTKYYEEKRKEKIEREETKKKYLEALLHIKEERNSLAKKKLELEERKIVALEKLAAIYNKNSV